MYWSCKKILLRLNYFFYDIHFPFLNGFLKERKNSWSCLKWRTMVCRSKKNNKWRRPIRKSFNKLPCCKLKCFHHYSYEEERKITSLDIIFGWILKYILLICAFWLRQNLSVINENTFLQENSYWNSLTFFRLDLKIKWLTITGHIMQKKKRLLPLLRCSLILSFSTLSVWLMMIRWVIFFVLITVFKP